ncbi:MAG: hypothetical protein ABWZ77_05180 [Naasia sp.]
MAVKWVDAPPAPRPGRPKAVKEPKWAKEAREFRRNPGQWGILTTDAQSSLAWQLVHGAVRAFRGGRWEAVSRALPTSKPGRGQIYVRYLGDEGDDE